MSIAGPPSMMLDQPSDELAHQNIFKEVEAFVNSDMNFTVFPNPNTGDNFNINLDGVSIDELITLSIFDMSGKVIYEATMSTSAINGTNIEFEHSLAAGVYTVRIAGKDYADTQLMVVSSER
jgi:hypothetical protein